MTCADPEHDFYPYYGVAPHECYYKKGPEFRIGESTIHPVSEWPDNFVVELEPGETAEQAQAASACGVYYCSTCKAGMPPVNDTPSPSQAGISAPSAEMNPKDARQALKGRV